MHFETERGGGPESDAPPRPDGKGITQLSIEAHILFKRRQRRTDSTAMKKALIALAFGTLALGMTEFVMMGILPDVARGLGITITQAGHLI